jgi:hypothetical protein
VHGGVRHRAAAALARCDCPGFGRGTAVAEVACMLSRCLALLLLSATFSPACGSTDEDPEFPYGLDDVRELSVTAYATTLPGAPRPTLKVSIDGNAECIAAGSEFAVTLPGATTAVLEPGDNDVDTCGVFGPHAFLALPDGPMPTPTIVTVGDQFKTIQLDLGDLLVPRQAALVVPADRALHSGQTLEVVWAPALGVADTGAWALLSAPGYALSALADGDARMTAIAPTFAADIDDVSLSVSLRGERAVACEGARCTAGGEWGALFPVALRRE